MTAERSKRADTDRLDLLERRMASLEASVSKLADLTAGLLDQIAALIADEEEALRALLERSRAYDQFRHPGEVSGSPRLRETYCPPG